jgi:hypothetical protein
MGKYCPKLKTVLKNEEIFSIVFFQILIEFFNKRSAFFFISVWQSFIKEDNL